MNKHKYDEDEKIYATSVSHHKCYYGNTQNSNVLLIALNEYFFLPTVTGLDAHRNIPCPQGSSICNVEEPSLLYNES